MDNLPTPTSSLLSSSQKLKLSSFFHQSLYNVHSSKYCPSQRASWNKK
ncbi:hypothetical protein MNB_SV-13-1139 [hydrothermal vent metagenome]|uniref:Uncharacterized protein n=1 Tax=hydrothermal vent metagenome TaxID=652676 RepID=A0A1W1CLG4_9ZZZZ